MATRKKRATKAKARKAAVLTAPQGGPGAQAGKRLLPRMVRFIYKFPDLYNPVYSNGAYGGVGPQADLVINFYHERQALPYSVTSRVAEGRVAKEIARDPDSEYPTLIRFVTTGVVMDLPAAKRLHGWLGQQIAILENIKGTQ